MRKIKLEFRKVITENSFFNTMKVMFLLPNYFSYNYDSLDECMRDLSWIEEDNILVKVENLSNVKDKNINLYNKIIESIEIYTKFWDNSNKKSVRFIIDDD